MPFAWQAHLAQTILHAQAIAQWQARFDREFAQPHCELLELTKDLPDGWLAAFGNLSDVRQGAFAWRPIGNGVWCSISYQSGPLARGIPQRR